MIIHIRTKTYLISIIYLLIEDENIKPVVIFNWRGRSSFCGIVDLLIMTKEAKLIDKTLSMAKLLAELYRIIIAL